MFHKKFFLYELYFDEWNITSKDQSALCGHEFYSSWNDRVCRHSDRLVLCVFKCVDSVCTETKFMVYVYVPTSGGLHCASLYI
jgi:hypothetical protein